MGRKYGLSTILILSALRKDRQRDYDTSMLTGLRALKEEIDKHRGALKEDFSLHDYMQTQDISVEAFPFPHIVVDNFLKDEIYERLLKHFQSVLDRGFSQEADSTKFHPFLNLRGKYEYDGYMYVPRPEEEPALEIFFTLAWNLFISKIFRQSTGWCTSLAYHHHSIGDRTGFVHHDHASRHFLPDDKLSNGIIFRENGKTPSALQEVRAIALLYYLGGDVWREGDGGETGIYTSEKESPIKLIAPKNNRLFAFQISPRSFHAFQKNVKPRSSIVQWFHVPIR